MSKESQKVLLLGRSAAGKTSMKKVIFTDLPPKNTKQLHPTVDVSMDSIDFLNLKLKLWDCGGQTLYMGGYVDERKPFMFHDVKAMVYVFDVENLDEQLDRDHYFYMECLGSLRKYSPSAQVFCLIHKMDLLDPAHQQSMFESRQSQLLKMSVPTRCRCYMSSIYQDSLYHAWSAIVHELVPNVREMKRCLLKFAETMECEEVLLVERVTFLVVFQYRKNDTEMDYNGSERAAQVIKRFQKACQKGLVQLGSMVVRHSNFILVADVLTPFMFILVVVKNGKTLEGVIIQNIKNAREHFTRLENLKK